MTYTINPWMDPTRPVDRRRALAQWETLRATYTRLGHEVQLVEPLAGLPDMVFAANGGLVVDGVAVGARFATAERAPEADVFLGWLQANGYPDAAPPQHVSEGEGDFLLAGGVLLAGTGFRTSELAHAEAAVHFQREVVTLELADPRYYHLDTALCVLDDDTIAYLPGAFAPASRETLARRYPDAVVVEPGDAEVLALNAVSDGRHVVLPVEARRFAAQVARRGFVPVFVDLSELRKAGGGPKCCTLELRPAATRQAVA